MLLLNFTPFPELQTERLILRRIVNDDFAELFALRSNPLVMKYINRPQPSGIKDIEELVGRIDEGIKNNVAIGWGIALKTNSQLIGTIGFHYIEKENHRAEIGYLLSQVHWRKGLISEAVNTVIHFGFNAMALHSIVAHINPENEASRRLLQKFNFLKEAYFKEDYFFDGRFLDTEIYSLLQRYLPVT